MKAGCRLSCSSACVSGQHITTLHVYAWLICAERQYKGVTSPPVPLNLQDLSLDRTQAAQQAAAAGSQQASAAANVAAGGATKGGRAGGAQEASSEVAALPSEQKQCLAALGAGWLALTWLPCFILSACAVPQCLHSGCLPPAVYCLCCRPRQPAQGVPPAVRLGPAVG